MTVIPVVDYEPALAAGPQPPPVRPTGSGHRHLHAVRTGPPEPSDQFRRAATFTDAALRSVLEVIDRRRPITQLRPMLSTGLIDSVVSFARAAPARQSGAVLRRVRLQAIAPDERAFEVSASYTRGPRLHAVACRVEQVSTPQGGAWQVVALHMG
ncbi:MAG TPA: Rv3235 family protein [Mycobacterium sp.]